MEFRGSMTHCRGLAMSETHTPSPETEVFPCKGTCNIHPHPTPSVGTIAEFLVPSPLLGLSSRGRILIPTWDPVSQLQMGSGDTHPKPLPPCPIPPHI